IKVKTNIGDTKLELSNIRIEPVDAGMFLLPSGVIKRNSGEKDINKTAVTSILEGSSPWGRRITKGGEIHVKTDPNRPVQIIFEYITNDGVCTYWAIPAGKDANEIKPIVKDRPEKGRLRKIEIEKNKRIERVIIRADAGTIFARVVNKSAPFSFEKEEKNEEGYLIRKELRGVATDPERKLTISVTGDNQDAPDSEVTLTCYQKQYENKVFEKKVTVVNGKTETWEFSPGDQIKTLELSVGEDSGIKYRVEQPGIDEKKTVAVTGQSQSEKAETPPKVVRTTPVNSYGRKDAATKKTGTGLGKKETGEILNALNSGDTATVKKYLDKGMDPNVLIYGSPLLQKAANLSSTEMVKLIIERGGDLNYKDRSGNDALAQAQSNKKSFQEIIPLLVKSGIAVDKNTPIWKIAFKTKGGNFEPGVMETLEYLLSKGADVNTPISKSGNTLLMFASKMAWLEPVEFYLDHGADVNARDKEGNTALSWSRTERNGEQPFEKQNRKAIIDLLESKGAKPN
ncbi:MAG: ankyrin repeat domain-containing protein, partial [Deltaproteobacteria bacterium]|nr:ankyrin repeat domain-containing protein [Deltaproteobacteria bacterium]